MNDEELIAYIKTNPYSRYKNNPSILSEIDRYVASKDIDPASCTAREKLYIIKNQLEEIPSCKICRTRLKLKSYGFGTYCSKKCYQQDKVSVAEKRKKTMIARYGKDNPSKLEGVKEKKKETLLKNYGVSHQMHSDEVKAKLKKTVNEKYGVDNVLLTEESKSKSKKAREKNKDFIREKIKHGKKLTYLEKLDLLGEEYKFERQFAIDDYHGVDRQNKYPFKCTLCGLDYVSILDDGTLPLCPKCHKDDAHGTSKPERDIIAYLQSLNVPVVHNDRISIYPYELDIFIPSMNIAIELDGLYWHSEIGGHKKRNYHLEKTKLCEENGIRLIHVFEDEWNFKRDIVKSRLQHILKRNEHRIHARKCTITLITPSARKEFLDKYHLQGDCQSSIQYGAFFEGELIAVMSFGKIRYRKEKGYELLRYAVKSNVAIPGIASRLLKAYEKQYTPTTLISYADRRWSNGKLYETLNFKRVKFSDPSYFYMKKGKYIERLNRINFQKHKLKNKLESFDPSATEWENMKANGYDRIWDCGNYVFEKSYE